MLKKQAPEFATLSLPFALGKEVISPVQNFLGYDYIHIDLVFKRYLKLFFTL